MKRFFSQEQIVFLFTCLVLVILITIKTVTTVTAITFNVIGSGTQQESWAEIQGLFEQGHVIPFPSSETYHDILNEKGSLLDMGSLVNNDVYPVEYLQSFFNNNNPLDNLLTIKVNQSDSIENNDNSQGVNVSSDAFFVNEKIFAHEKQSERFDFYTIAGVNDSLQIIDTLQIKDVSSYISFINVNRDMNELSYLARDFFGNNNYGDVMSELETLESDQLIALAKERGITKQEAARIYRMVKDNPILSNFVNQKGERYKTIIDKLENY